jgi:transcriptional regulator
MYVPSEFSARAAMGWQVAREHPFALLLVPPEPVVAHLPFVVDAETNRVLAHVARASSIARRIDGTTVRVVFAGPHGYITPRWYAHPREQVPTWNYVTAVATGVARLLDRSELLTLLERLAGTFEPPDGWQTSWLDPELRDSLAEDIVGFEVAVSEMRPKLKLSQNRTAEDRQRVMDALQARDAPGDAELLAWMRDTD